RPRRSPRRSGQGASAADPHDDTSQFDRTLPNFSLTRPTPDGNLLTATPLLPERVPFSDPSRQDRRPPLLFLLLTTALVRAIGHVSRPGLKPWPVAIRWGLAVMFTVTGISHFAGMRDALIAMVPPWLPGAAALVTITGVLELLGAAGLLVRPTRIWAAIGLGLMLIVSFPANVHMSLNAEKPPCDDTIVPRTIMQLIFLAAVAPVLLPEIRRLRAGGRRRKRARNRSPSPRTHR